MNAINAFEVNIKRAKTLVNLHKFMLKRARSREATWLQDLLRTTVVFAVSALDAYMHDKIPEKLPAFLQKREAHSTGKFVEALKEEIKYEKLIEIVFKKRPKEHLKSAIRRSLADKTIQDPSKIEGALKILGIRDLWFQLGRKLHVRKDKAKIYVQDYVTRRHKIVHEGDMGTAKRTKHRLRPITRKYAYTCIEKIEEFVIAIDKLINELV